jgi:tRNA pseudouridine synthase 10
VALTGKRKTYAATCWCEKPHTKEELIAKLNRQENLIIDQVTPVRVVHRRALMSRKKVIHSLKVTKWFNPHFFVLAIESSAGTYIKEFVHSDLGRTTPSVGSLLGGCECNILQLDVLSLVT